MLSSDCYNGNLIFIALYQILMSVQLTMVDVMRPVLMVMVATHVIVTVTYNCYLISGLVDVRDMKLKSVYNFSCMHLVYSIIQGLYSW